MKESSTYGYYLLLFAFIALSLLCFAGCKTTSSIETNNENHKVSELVDKVDSLFKSTVTWQQDIYSKQSSLIDSIKEREKNDSSHSVVLNEKGDTIKETIIIERVIEKEHSTDNKESETIVRLQSKVDSLVNICVENKALTDSLLKEHSKETVIVKEQSLWQKAKSAVGGYAIVLTTIFFIYIGIKLIYKHRKRP